MNQVPENKLKDFQSYQHENCDLLKTTLHQFWLSENQSFNLRSKYLKLSEFAYLNDMQHPIFYYMLASPFYGRLVLADNNNLSLYKEYPKNFFK